MASLGGKNSRIGEKNDFPEIPLKDTSHTEFSKRRVEMPPIELILHGTLPRTLCSQDHRSQEIHIYGFNTNIKVRNSLPHSLLSKCKSFCLKKELSPNA